MAALLAVLVALTAIFFAKPDFLVDDISSVYVSMLLRAVSFSTFQALVSLMVAASLALVIAFSTIWLSKKRQFIYFEVLRISGLMLFFAPTLVASLTYLKWGTAFEWLPKFGWLPIVFVHTSLNVLFLAQAFSAVMIREFHESSRMLEVAQVFSLPRLTFYKNAFYRPLRQELLSWAPLVFWWAFSSFTTVLVLGGGPKYSSPEVLLFYLIGAGDRPARLYVLILIQILIGIGAIFYARKLRFTIPKMAERPSVVNSLKTSIKQSHWERGLAVFGVLLALFFIGFWTPAFYQAFSSMRFDVEMWAPFTVSIDILWRALVLGVVAVLLGSIFNKKLYAAMAGSLVVSPMIVVGVVTQAEWFHSLGSSPRLWLTAALCVWSTLPILALWVLAKQRELESVSSDILKTFGVRQWFRFKFLYIPLLGVPVLTFFLMLFLSVVGDVGVVTSIMGSAQPSMAQSIYSRVSAYQFDVAFTMFGYLVIGVLPVWLILVLMRRKHAVREV